MTQLKIDNNPFAKGFRENGQLRVKKRQNAESSNGKRIYISLGRRFQKKVIDVLLSDWL